MSKYTVPAWMLETMPERKAEFEQLAFKAAVHDIQPQLDGLIGFEDSISQIIDGGTMTDLVQLMVNMRKGAQDVLNALEAIPSSALTIITSSNDGKLTPSGKPK